MANYPEEDNPIEIYAAEKFYHNAVLEDLRLIESVAQAEVDARTYSEKLFLSL